MGVVVCVFLYEEGVEKEILFHFNIFIFNHRRLLYFERVL